MTTQTPSIALPTRRGPGRRLGLGLAAAALALAVGAGLWQADRDGGSETAPPPPVAVEQATGARSLEGTPTYYLVGSQAEAAALRVIVAQLGTPPLPEVVTVTTAADADAFVRSMSDLNAIRAAFGQPSVTVVDLRPPAATGTTADPLTRELDALTAAAAAAPADTMGGLAELIRDGGSPVGIGAEAPAARTETGRCEPGLGSGAAHLAAC